MAPADGGAIPPSAKSASNPQLTTKTAEMKKGNAFFRSTWHDEDRKSQWGIASWFFHLLNIDPIPPNFEAPVHAKTDKMPYVSEMDLHRWILPRALVPFAIHCGLYYYGGIKLHPLAAFALYTTWFKVFGVMLLNMLRAISKQCGFLDGTHPRDGVPDQSINKVLVSLMSTSTYRPMMAIMLAYDRNQAPHMSFPWIVAYIGLYNVALDFYFYWYHLAMHEVPWLWKFHSTHHKTKHPNPALTLFADEVQEVFDIAIIPLCAYLTMRALTSFDFCASFNFYDWWLCQMYQMFTELAGHSGCRLYATSPSSFGLLPKLGLDIVIEDHDLHHRQGYRKSGNYGKQSRVWDHLFGTTLPREECIPSQMETKKQPIPW